MRTSLKNLQVVDLEVTSPTSWQRPASRPSPERVVAGLQVSGQLAPARLQDLVRGVGGLPGVRLAPVATEADRPGDRAAGRGFMEQKITRGSGGGVLRGQCEFSFQPF